MPAAGGFVENHCNQLLVPYVSKSEASVVLGVLPVETQWRHEPHEKQKKVLPMLLSAPFARLYPQMCNLLGGRAMVASVLRDLGEANDSNLIDKNFKEGVGSYSTSIESLGTISTPPKPYRPPLPSLYKEPELGSDLNDGMEWLFESHGKAIKWQKEELPPQDDIIEFDAKRDSEELS